MVYFKKVKFFSLLFLCSCVSMSKEEQTENIIALPNLQPSFKESLDTGFFALGDWPSKNWWEMFNSSQLESLIQEALQGNPDLQSVGSRIHAAEEAAKVVRSKLFPLVYFNAEDTWQLLSHHGLYRALNPDVDINATLIDLTLSFNYEFDFWGKNRNLYRAALGEARARAAEWADVQLITTTSVAIGFFALKTNLVRLRLYEALYHIRLGVFELQNHLRKHALFSVLTPLFTEESVLEAEKLLHAIKEEVQVNKHLINILMGKSPDNVLEVDDDLPLLPETLTIPETLSLDFLARRPDLMAQIWKVESIADEVGAAKADFYPNINLGAFLGLESVFYSMLFNSQSKTMGLEPALHLPIFTAGAIKANVRAKKALFDEEVYRYNGLILRSVKEVADLLVLAESLFKQKQDQVRIVETAAKRLRVTALREKSGLDSQFAKYAVEEELIEKQLEDVALLYGQYLASIKLVKALGGGYLSEYVLPLKNEGARE
ncbi:MAG: efflux transporter outer membrane subunit [Chlamydiota bacterium]